MANSWHYGYIYVESPYLTIGCFMYTWKGTHSHIHLRYIDMLTTLLNLITPSMTHSYCYHIVSLSFFFFLYLETVC